MQLETKSALKQISGNYNNQMLRIPLNCDVDDNDDTYRLF